MYPSHRLLSASKKFDVTIVGGGIIGCATARELKINRPNLKVALIEKENQLAFHQSGRNSGVLHAGIYYQPGSLKAKLCVEGIDLAYAYLDTKKIPYAQCGKLIVAVDHSEINNLEALYKRAQQNGCKRIELVGPEKIREIQPHCRGVKAIWSPYTGIVDWAVVTQNYAEDFRAAGGEIFCNHPLVSIEQSADTEHPIRLVSDAGKPQLNSKFVITCSGLQSDKVAQMTGCSPLPKIVPFRGEYLYLRPEKHYLVTTNIYPVPNIRLPFLGVHFTPTMRNEVLIGPNAVLATKREGYSYFDFSPSEFLDAISFKGMRKLMVKHFRLGVEEFYRGIFFGTQIKSLQRYIPEIERSDITRGRSGVRAQALDENGTLIDDFVFDDGTGELAPKLLHVRNAPSPAATSSLAIAKMIVKKSIEKFHF